MKKQVIILFIIGFSLFAMNLYSQGNFGHVSPEVSDLIKYGEVPVSLFTGQINMEIPIYRIKDQDFDVPISLLYTSEGFKPEKRSDFVGLDWTLIAGGCISREIYGTADESNASGQGSKLMGYLFATEQKSTYNPDKIWNFQNPPVIKTTSPATYDILLFNGREFLDYQPDLFRFNFNGHSGQFMINGNGSAIANNKGYKVDISGLSRQRTYEILLPDPSVIKITSPDGYVYEFGGNLDALEFSVSFKDGNMWVTDINGSSTEPAILAWHLSKITAPNGRNIKFNYIKDDITYSSSRKSPLWQSETTTNKSGKAVKKAVLESIEVDGIIKLKIEFIKSVEKTMVTTNGVYNDMFFVDHADFNHAIYQLDSIYVKYGSDNLYKYAFLYTNRDKRRFLSNVIQPDGSEYKFAYNHPSAYPLPGLPQSPIDQDGYWTGNNSSNSFGLLSSVNYPTGGHSTFTYEAHKYAYALEFNLDSITKELTPYSDLTNNVHGARIKKITQYDSNSEITKVKEKEYFYTTLMNGTVSSGILYSTRPYSILRPGANGVTPDNITNAVTGSVMLPPISTPKPATKVYITDPFLGKYYNIGEYPVGYSSVFEKNMDGSYSQYCFSDWKNNPDRYEANIKYCDPNFVPSSNTYKTQMMSSLVSKMTSNADRRGLLTDKYIYDSSDKEKARERYLYEGVFSAIPITTDFDSDSEKQSSEFISFKPMEGGGIARKIYLSYHPLLYKEEKIDNVVKKEKYSYNSYGLLSKKSIIIGTSDSLQVNYTYPFNSIGIVYAEMKNKNQLDFTVEEINSVVRGNKRQETKRIKTDYINDNTRTKGLILPDKVSSSYFGSSFQTDCTYDLYDSKGRCLQYTQNGVTVVYLWSYNYQYPIIEIKNATYEQVKSALGYSDTNINTLAENANPDVATISMKLRSNSNLQQSLITSYTYKLPIGIASMTDPRGTVTYFDYDALGRLKETYYYENNDRTKKRKVESYEYHYKD